MKRRPRAHWANTDSASRPLRAVAPNDDNRNPPEVEFVQAHLLSVPEPGSDGYEPLPEPFASELRTAAELARMSLAPGTLENYRRAWRQFNDFCLAHGVQSMPAAPQIVALYLAGAAVQADDNGAPLRDDYQELVRGRLSAGSVSVHCAAIDRAHEAAGYRRPSHHPDVHAVIRGIRRAFGTRPEDPKQPIELDTLIDLLHACSRGALRRKRDRAAILLSDRGWTPPQLAAIRIERDIARTANGLHIADSTGRDASGLELHAEADATYCAVAAVQDLTAYLPPHGPLLVREVDEMALKRLSETPHALSRQAITELIRRRAANAGLDLPRTGVPTFSPSELRHVIDCTDMPSLVDVRDRSILLTGWSAALRQSNLRRLKWSDFDKSMGELKVNIRRDKTDPYGGGRSVWLPRGRTELTCPVTAWEVWRAAVAAAIGSDPVETAPEEPCFVPIDRHGHLVRTSSGKLQQFSKDGINDLVKGLCSRAGLDPAPYGSHSLRAGFITEASKRGESPTAIQQVTGHKTLEMVSRYTRPYDLRAFAPSRRMGL